MTGLLDCACHVYIAATTFQASLHDHLFPLVLLVLNSTVVGLTPTNTRGGNSGSTLLITSPTVTRLRETVASLSGFPQPYAILAHRLDPLIHPV